MKLSKKKTCNGCKAGPFDWICTLNFPVEPKKESHGAIIEWKPKSECYKPTTTDQYMQAKNLIGD